MTTASIPDLLAALPAPELHQLFQGVQAAAEGYNIRGRGRLCAWWLTVEWILTHEITRRAGGDTTFPCDLFALQREEAAHLDLLELARVARILEGLRDSSPPEAAALFAALLAPVDAALDRRYRRG